MQGELYKLFDHLSLYQSPQLQKHYCIIVITVPPQCIEEINPDGIMKAKENVLQSEESLAVTDGFEVGSGKDGGRRLCKTSHECS